jgi:DNA-binding GntR family transcriptional regulator
MAKPDQAPDPADPRKYIRLAAELRRRIQDGTLRPGDPAPSITALAAERGGWARQTVAKAFQILEGEGLLIRVRGLGYFVLGAAGIDGSSAANQPPISVVADLLHARG